MEQRRQLALKLIDLKKAGLELGPLFSPLVLKTDGQISYVDHMSTEDLKTNYGFESATLDSLVEVDYVLGGNSLVDTLAGKKFDYVVASHVVEHLPDMVRWFKDIAAVLKPGGLLSLVVPDKRFTFDITRNVSRPADILGAYFDKRTKTSSVTMYDYISEVRAEVVAHEVWQKPAADYSKKPRMYTREEARQTTLKNLAPKEYVDCHCNVFTPYSFVDILKTLIEFGLFDFEIVSFDSTPENLLEFYVTMRKSNVSKKQRLASLPQLAAPIELWELQVKLADVQATLDNVIGSRSWRFTKPLRDLKTRLRPLAERIKQPQ